MMKYKESQTSIVTHRIRLQTMNKYVVMIPEEAEDMWHLYNLLQIGDYLKSTAVRKVTSESQTGSTSSQKVRTTLKIQVDNIDFDTHAATLHVKGRNVEENQHVKLGAFHTLDLELNRKFTLEKGEWDAAHLYRIDIACDATQHADVAAVVMQEGLAHVCLLTASMTLVRAKIDVSIPRKRKGITSQHDKAIAKFFELISQAIIRHVNFNIVKCVLVASPGFLKEQFCEHFFSEASKQGNKTLLEQKNKFITVHSSSGFKHSLNEILDEVSSDETSENALNEVLQDPTVALKLADTKASGEVKALQQFYELLGTEPARAYYGLGHVERANKSQAIETLMISDDLFRSKDLVQRRRYVRLVESVKYQGGVVRIFSSLHVSGEQLALLCGIAAILRFPMPDIEDEDSGDSD